MPSERYTVKFKKINKYKINFRPNELVLKFLENELSWIPGLQGIFLAALYSAGISTLSASYNALTTLVIEDVVKNFQKKITNKNQQLIDSFNLKLFKILRKSTFFFNYNLIIKYV